MRSKGGGEAAAHTQLYLWFLADSVRLSKNARRRIARAETVYVSAVSIWEASIQVGIGKLKVAGGALVAGIAASGFMELPVSAKHAAAVTRLPRHHRDPFDRLLLAQAVSEPLRLLTADELLRRYSELVEVV